MSNLGEKLASVGACFAVRSDKFVSVNDPMGSKPSYHVHPDADYPHQKHILTFETQQQILDYVKSRQEMATHLDIPQGVDSLHDEEEVETLYRGLALSEEED